MIAMLLRLHPKPGKRAELVEFLKWDAQVARDSEPGTLRFDVYDDGEHNGALLVYEAYVDDAAFEFHKQQAPFEKFRDVRTECVEKMGVIFGGKSPLATNALAAETQ